MQATAEFHLSCIPGALGTPRLTSRVNHNPRNFRSTIVRDFVATR